MFFISWIIFWNLGHLALSAQKGIICMWIKYTFSCIHPFYRFESSNFVIRGQKVYSNCHASSRGIAYTFSVLEHFCSVCLGAVQQFFLWKACAHFSVTFKHNFLKCIHVVPLHTKLRNVHGVQERTCTQSTGVYMEYIGDCTWSTIDMYKLVHRVQACYELWQWVTSTRWESVGRHWVTTTIHIHMQSCYCLYSSRTTNYPRRGEKFSLHNNTSILLLSCSSNFGIVWYAKWTRKISYTSDSLESTHLTSHVV